MLSALWVEGYALVDSLELRFEPGFTAVTGETGAGKSIIVGALQLALGGRADLTRIADGHERAAVAAEFALAPGSAAVSALAEMGIAADEGRVVLARTLSGSAGSACRVNGQPATVSMVRALGEALVEFHGQHEHQTLLRPGRHLDLVDAFGGDELASARESYGRLWGEHREVRERLEALSRTGREMRRREDLLRYQVDEIETAAIAPEEDKSLAAERLVLANAERLVAESARAAALLSSDEGPGALAAVAAAAKVTNDLARLDARLAPMAEELDAASIAVDEAARALAGYASSVEFDPRRLEAIEDRLALLRTLKQKYGDTLEEVLRYRDEAASELETIEHSDEERDRLAARQATLVRELTEAGEALSRLRARAGAELTARVSERVRDLGMTGGTLSVEHETISVPEEMTARGADRLQFLAVTNPGRPPLPLAKIASGGELARTMLAIRAVCATADSVPTIVFDEVDAGIGGEAATRVGRELRALAEGRTEMQVICVTHSPQIATAAHHQIAVSKSLDGPRATVSAATVAGSDREGEIARMLGGPLWGDHLPAKVAAPGTAKPGRGRDARRECS